jgi:hypothetical protein
MADFILNKFKKNQSTFSGPKNPTSYFEYMRGAVNPNLVGSNINHGVNPKDELPISITIPSALMTETANVLMTEDGNTLIW